MPYRYKREPLTQDEANRLANACQTHEEKLVVWTLLDTGLRVSELAGLTKANPDSQGYRIMVYGKGGPYGSSSKRRVIPSLPGSSPSSRARGLAPHEQWRPQVVAYGRATPEDPDARSVGAVPVSDGAGLASHARSWSWAALMRRAFEIDVLACPRCGGRLRLIATVEDPASFARSWPTWVSTSRQRVPDLPRPRSRPSPTPTRAIPRIRAGNKDLSAVLGRRLAAVSLDNPAVAGAAW